MRPPAIVLLTVPLLALAAGCASTDSPGGGRDAAQGVDVFTRVDLLEYRAEGEGPGMPPDGTAIGPTPAFLVPTATIESFWRGVEAQPGFTEVASMILFEIAPSGTRVRLDGSSPDKAGHAMPGHLFDVTAYVDPQVTAAGAGPAPVLIEARWRVPEQERIGKAAVSLPGAVFTQQQVVVMEGPTRADGVRRLALIAATPLGPDGRVQQR